MNYTELGETILGLVGGPGNVASHTNCMTRLRINVEDQAAVDVAGIRGLDGVQGVVDGPQLQIVVGPGHAERLREGFGDVLAAARAAESGSEADVVVAAEKVADDVREAVAMARARYPNAVIAVVGESMGGSVTAAAVPEPYCPSAAVERPWWVSRCCTAVTSGPVDPTESVGYAACAAGATSAENKEGPRRRRFRR